MEGRSETWVWSPLESNSVRKGERGGRKEREGGREGEREREREQIEYNTYTCTSKHGMLHRY